MRPGNFARPRPARSNRPGAGSLGCGRADDGAMQFAAEGRMQALVFAVWPDLDRYVSIIPNDHQSLPVRRDRDHSLSIMGINLRLRDGQQMKAGALRVKSIDLQDIVPAAFVMQGICARALFQYVLVFLSLWFHASSKCYCSFPTIAAWGSGI